MTVFSSNTHKMFEINKEDFSHLGTKIENMLDVIIKNGDEIENNQNRSSLKFSDDNSKEKKILMIYSIKIYFLMLFLLMKNNPKINKII